MSARHAAHLPTHFERMTEVPPVDTVDRATRDSIAAARAAQQRERAEFFERTGIPLNRDGRPMLTRRLAPQAGQPS